MSGGAPAGGPAHESQPAAGPPAWGGRWAAEATPLFADINITPLVDVVLVLLVICLISASASVDAVREGPRLDVQLPQAAGGAAPAQDAPLAIIGMAKDGRLFFDGELTPPGDLEARLAALHAQAPATAVVLDADGGLSHAEVVRMLDCVRAAGFASVSIGAEQAP